MNVRRLGFVALGVLVLVALFAAPVSLAQAESGAVETARLYLQRNARQLGLTGADVNDVTVSSSVVSRHSGVTHVYFQQRYRGIGVFNGLLNVNVAKDGTVISSGSRFVPKLASAAGPQNARRTAAEAAGAAASHLNLRATRAFQVLGRSETPDQATRLSDGGIAARPIEAQLVWVPVPGGVELAWSIEIEEVDGQHWWIVLIDAETGAALAQYDLVVQDSAQAIAEATARPAGKATALPDFPLTDGALYNVFPLPFESPTDGSRALVFNAADPSASPFGWHDTDGVPGPEFTRTRGNNVHAYTDIDFNNIADPGSDPDGGAGLVFDFPLDLSLNPPTYRPAVVTNLFYWNNVVHDITHGYGFDEAAGNFQVNNYGHGGLGGDDVRAEAQDGSGTNNANFGTGVDGVRPRMQMFVWTHPFPNLVDVNAPGSIAGSYAASRAAFGPPLTVAGPLTANVTLVNDGVGPTSDACEPLVGFPPGDIALLDRGTCSFIIKVKTAQNAGAAAVIVVNNVATNPITMAGVDPTIVIPAAMVSLADGNLFKANAPVNVTLRANPVTSIDRDSDLDAGVIAHEYGHGISNRLTGGPAAVTCLQNAEQMGEGWSDWLGMTLTTDPADTATTPRGVGTYLSFQPADGRGIRPTQYTTDLSVNPATYASVANVATISQPHGIGYVWNSMLWEVYWNLVDRYGYNADLYDSWSSGGNNLAIQLVMDGLKLQPCSPGFVDGRNAILAADQALTGGTNRCEIWRGFTKRGLGASANQGSSFNRADGVEAFNLPASCTAAVFGGFRSPVAGAPDVNAVNAGSTVPVKFALSGGAGAALVVDSQPVDCVTLVPFGEVPQPPAFTGGTGIKVKGNEYQFNWKTDAAWAGSCRRLTLRIPAASDAVAYFSFF